MSLMPPCPVDLATLLQTSCDRRRLHHVSLVWCPAEKVYQASFKRPDTNGYKISIDPNPVQALLKVLGPDYGHTWEEILGDLTEEDGLDPDDLL